MADFQRPRKDFAVRGMVLSRPVDHLKPDEYRILFNTRARGEDQIWPRDGLTKLSDASVTDPIHSIKRMDDAVPSPSNFPGAFRKYNLAVGAGTKLYNANWNDVPQPATLTLGEVVELYGSAAVYSGNPMSMCVAKSDYSDRPWIWVSDANKMRKLLSSNQAFHVGISPPNYPPFAEAMDAPGDVPDGLDTGDTGVLYIYRFRARAAVDVNTGQLSGPGVAIRQSAGVDAKKQKVRVRVDHAHPDPQVHNLDIERFGGSLQEWVYVGTISNVVGHEFWDVNSDLDIAANPRLPEDNFQPWTGPGEAATGTCSISGTTITRLSGDPFKFLDPLTDTPYWLPGTTIEVGGEVLSLYRSPDSADVLEVTETPADWNTGGMFFIRTPLVAHKPLQFVWGPWGGGVTGLFYFACGDPLAPGVLKWTNGNDPESTSDANELEITAPGEPLQNGGIFDSKAFVFSTQRLFLVYPSFGETSQFYAVEVPGAKGLWNKYCILVCEKGIFYRGKDGLYRTTGGASVNITDGDLYGLFPHDEPLGTREIDGLLESGIRPVDDTDPTQERLSYADGMVYYEYIDKDNERRTLVFDTSRDGWVSRDTYTPQITTHYDEEANSVHRCIMGSEDGWLYTWGNLSDDGTAISLRVRSGSFNEGEARARKFYGDAEADYDSDCEGLNFRLGFERFSFFSQTVESGVDLSGRRRSILDINQGRGQYAVDVGIEIWGDLTLGRPKLYGWEPALIPKPEVTALRSTDFDNAGHDGSKFFQGVRIWADTLGKDRTVGIWTDAGERVALLDVNHMGESVKPYSFDVPFISQLVRIIPSDANFWRIMKIEWIFEPAPELVENWITQETTHDFPGYHYHRDAFIALWPSAAVTLAITADGATQTYAVPAELNVYNRPYMVLRPQKARYSQYSLRGGPFRLFVKDCTVRVKPWADAGQFQVKQPFGDLSREFGARI